MPHDKSKECFAAGVVFVIAVDQILSNPMAPTEYGEFYKKCLLDRVVGAVPVYIFENTMLCALMCCCNEHPAQGSKPENAQNAKIDVPSVEGSGDAQPARLQLYQACVKDILDGANILKSELMKFGTAAERKTKAGEYLGEKLKIRNHIPTTRFIAEPDLNITQMRVGRGRMNPGGLRRMPGDQVKRPDIGILGDPSDVYGGRKGDIEQEGGFKRFVEMKFPTEPNDPAAHKKQLKAYRSFGKHVTFMATGAEENQGDPVDSPTSEWYCNCSGAPEEVMQPAEGFNAQEELERRFNNFIDILGGAIPWGRLGMLPKIGKLPKILGPVGVPLPRPY